MEDYHNITFKKAFLSSFTSAFTVTAVAPLNRMKILYQTSPIILKEQKPLNLNQFANRKILIVYLFSYFEGTRNLQLLARKSSKLL